MADTVFKLNAVGSIALVTIDNGEDYRKPTTRGRSAFESAVQVLDELEQGDWSAAVFTGKPFVFCVGADIDEFTKVGSAEAALEGTRAGLRVLDVDPENGAGMPGEERPQSGRLLTAGMAPRAPEVHEHGLSRPLRERDALAGDRVDACERGSRALRHGVEDARGRDGGDHERYERDRRDQNPAHTGKASSTAPAPVRGG